MKDFDQIIGYKKVKDELSKIADTLKNQKTYKALGVRPPKGLLLHGVPGVGKTLMAQSLIDASGWKAVTCRKSEPDGKFVTVIRKAFQKAAESAPAIVFLDDLDKFANDDEGHRNSEEYVTVQSCIDDVKSLDVFVLATVNEMRCLPRSLTRAGRFDRIIEIHPPENDDAVQIIEHYLKEKILADDLDLNTIADLLDGKSCATLETVMNEAGLMAGYERAECITMKHVVRACLQTVYRMVLDNDVFSAKIDLASPCRDSFIVCHEAGHVVTSEVLAPGNVVLVSSKGRRGHEGGFVQSRQKTTVSSYQDIENEVIGVLGGKAAVDIVYGELDMGAADDIDKAFELIRSLQESVASTGTLLHVYSEYRISENAFFAQESSAAAVVGLLYQKTKAILFEHRDFLDAVAQTLAEKKFLLSKDIARIREKCPSMNDERPCSGRAV